MPSLMVGDPSAYIGEGWVGGELFATGSYDVVATGSLVFNGTVAKGISKTFNSEASLGLNGIAARNILKNFTASGELTFIGTKLLSTVRMSSSAWSPAAVSDGSVGSGSSVWEAGVTSGGVIGSSFIGVWG